MRRGSSALPSVDRALTLFGAVAFLLAITASFHPSSYANLLNYPPAPSVSQPSGWFGAATEGAASPSEVGQVYTITIFYGLVQGGLSGLALSTARVGDRYTMSVTAVGLGIVTVTLCVWGFLAVVPLSEVLHSDKPALLRVLVPYLLLATYLIHAGLPGLSAKPTRVTPIGKSGNVMAVCGLLALVQGISLVFFTEAWLTKFVGGNGMPMAHTTTAAVLMAVAPMWGICIAGSGLVRLAIVSAGHTATIYAANCATTIYYAQFVGALAVSKTLSTSAPAAMTAQLYAASLCFMLSYFGGTIADDMAKKAN
jgi:hypothetical protein